MTAKGYYSAGNGLFPDLGCWLHSCYLVSENLWDFKKLPLFISGRFLKT